MTPPALLLAATALLFVPVLPCQDPSGQTTATAAIPGSWEGRWQGRIDLPRIGPVDALLVLGAPPADEQVQWDVGGFLRADLDTWPVAGKVADGTLALTVHSRGRRGQLELSMDRTAGGTEILVGTFRPTAGVPPAIPVRVTPANGAPDPVEAALPRGVHPVPADRDHPLTVDAQEVDGEDAAAIDQRVREFIAGTELVGLTIAVARSDGDGPRVGDVRSYGYADLPAQRPADGATRYRWASISKPLTAVVAMRLTAAGKLDLDGDVRQWVPEFPAKDHPVTVRQILCHQSGITHYSGAVRTEVEYDTPHPFVDPVVALDLFKATPLRFEPGSEYSYSTHAYTLLAAVLERVGGEPLGQLIAEHIIGPAGLRDLAPDLVWEVVPNRTRGYYHSGGELVQSLPDDISWKLAGGGLISSAADLARFGVAAVDGTLLDAETFAEWTTPQTTSAGKATASALGIRVGRLDGDTVLSHTGSQNETATALLIDPERRIAVALMCNTVGARLHGLGQDVLRILRDAR